MKDMAKRKIKQTFTKDEQTAYEEETERLRKLIDGYEAQISPLEAMKLFSTVDVEGFLNTLKTASEDYDEVTHDVKDAIAKMLVLNTYVAQKKVASIRLKPPFDEIIRHPLLLLAFHSGRHFFIFQRSWGVSPRLSSSAGERMCH